MRMHELPAPQRFTRMEHYRILPPDVMDEAGFHNNFSLSVYQGLVFQLLWLHTDYNRVSPGSRCPEGRELGAWG